jgi:hypothetical protein
MRLYLYATDNVDPALATNVTEWGLDPIEGEYDPQFEWDGRGADIATLGGRVIQDYGLVETDRKIKIAGRDLTQALKTAIESKFATVDGQWHFTARKAAGVAADVWKVQFRRVPRGFTSVLDGPVFAVGRMYAEPPDSGYERYTYEIVLLVVQKVA